MGLDNHSATVSAAGDCDRAEAETPAVRDVVADARQAQQSSSAGGLETLEELTDIVHRLACERPGFSEKWAGKAVAETGQGDVGDKVEKVEKVADLMYEEMADETSVGVVGAPSDDRVDIHKPVGVIGAHTPSTNCAATPVALALTAFKSGNALVISPSPFAVETCEMVVDDVQDALETRGLPRHLIQSLSRPIQKDKTRELLRCADAVQVTGSSSQVEMGETCGTPNYCVGAGNTVGIVESTAELTAAAGQIAHSVAFDNGLVCVCVSNVLVPPALAEELTVALEDAGGYVCSADEVSRLRETLYNEGSIDPDCIGQPAGAVASMSGFGGELEEESFIIAPLGEVDLENPLVGEDLSPVATLYEVPSEEAVSTTNEILDYQGSGHSCAIYGNRERAIEMATEIDVCRIALNQSSIGLSIGEHNRVDTSLSLGCGTWGGNQIDGNVTYEQFVDTTTLYGCTESADQSRRSSSGHDDQGSNDRESTASVLEWILPGFERSG